jgi:hypothetical protein
MRSREGWTHLLDVPQSREKGPFDGVKVFYSGASDVSSAESSSAKDLLEFVSDNGATVIDKFVAEEFGTVAYNEGAAEQIGVSVDVFNAMDFDDRVGRAYDADLKQVRKADCLIYGWKKSTGAGQEVQHALDHNRSVLVLAHESALDGVTEMITGAAASPKTPLQIGVYKDFDDAKRITTEFLAGVKDRKAWKGTMGGPDKGTQPIMMPARRSLRPAA